MTGALAVKGFNEISYDELMDVNGGLGGCEMPYDPRPTPEPEVKKGRNGYVPRDPNLKQYDYSSC